MLVSTIVNGDVPRTENQEPVGAENSVTSRGLHVLMYQAAESVSL